MNKTTRLAVILAVVAGAAALIRWTLVSQSDVSGAWEADFALPDTAAIDRIFIADMDGGSVLVERMEGERYWQLNGKHFARKDAVDLLLKTALRAGVRGPVPAAERETVIRLLASRGKKVEWYTGGDTPAKTWYIGTATPSHTGTYMLLETEEGKAAEPFIVHMEGFSGFLSTRFFTDEREWRYTGVFDFPGRELESVTCINTAIPAASFQIDVSEEGNLRVLDGLGRARTVLDSAGWQDRFLLHRKVHLETFNNYLSPAARDSLVATRPAFILRARGTGRTEPDSIELFWKKPTLDAYDEQGRVLPWDGARMYARVRGEIVLVQRFVFDPLIAPPPAWR
jgi:hypothetical protein